MVNKNVEIGRSAPVSRLAQVLLGDKKRVWHPDDEKSKG